MDRTLRLYRIKETQVSQIKKYSCLSCDMSGYLLCVFTLCCLFLFMGSENRLLPVLKPEVLEAEQLSFQLITVTDPIHKQHKLLLQKTRVVVLFSVLSHVSRAQALYCGMRRR